MKSGAALLHAGPRLAGYWLVSLLIAYAVGWAHLAPADAGADPAPPAPTTAPAPR